MRSSRIKLRDRCRPVNPRRGFTLVELLVVIFIIVLVSAATLPAILPALNSRRVSDASRLLQAELSRQRDLAVRANAPRGFRLLPDPIDPNRPDILTSSRLIAIEPAPDYAEGRVFRGRGMDNYIPSNARGPEPRLVDMTAFPTATFVTTYLRIIEKKFDYSTGTPPLPAEPTSWYWNIRQGDKIRLSDSGKQYTIVGPVRVSGPLLNPERFINNGPPDVFPTGPGSPPLNEEVIFVLNGEDDDLDGYIDEALDGIDNDGDGIIDPGFNGLDDDSDGFIDEIKEMYLHRNSDGSFNYPGYTWFNGITEPFATRQNEFEFERFVGKAPPSIEVGISYTIQRRPVPVEGARDVSLPTNVVIDMTTWNTTQERSRLPVDPFTGYVDVMIAPNGQVITAGASANNAPAVNYPYYHFWLVERDQVYPPINPRPIGFPFLLPMPKDTGGDPRIDASRTYPPGLPTLKGERRLLSINARSGTITSTAVETFYANNPSFPFEAAESGRKDVLP